MERDGSKEVGKLTMKDGRRKRGGKEGTRVGGGVRKEGTKEGRQEDRKGKEKNSKWMENRKKQTMIALYLRVVSLRRFIVQAQQCLINIFFQLQSVFHGIQTTTPVIFARFLYKTSTKHTN